MHDSEGDTKDRDLEDLLAFYVDRLNEGQKLDPDKVLAENPFQGPEILEYLEDYLSVDPNQPLGTLGDYTLRRQIGRGGMGVVYEAWQGSLDRQVALKVLPAGVAADNKAFMRFMREAKTAAQLSHPHVVAVFGMGVEQNTPYYSMEFVEGETLAQVLDKLKAAQPEAETPFGKKDCAGFFENLARAFADVGEGLQHAHSKGIIHRDIKPSNLILDTEGRLRILDFGLARLEGQESLTISGDVLGTPLYMSPEQARRKKIPVDHRTDVYSLGATLYEMLTLQPPFRGKDHQDTLSQIIERDPVELRRVNQHIPKDLETICLKCLRKDKEDRYRTAEALAQDLRRFARNDPIEARTEGMVGKVIRWSGRHRTGIIAACVSFAVVLVGLAVTVVLIAAARNVAATERDTAVKERNARERDLYVADMRLAMTYWESGSFQRFEQILDRHQPQAGRPDLRGWEWHYLNSLRNTSLARFEVHDDGATAVAWSSDGSRVACGGVDGSLQVFDIASRARLLQLSCPVGPTRAAAWSPTGERIAVVSQDGTLTMWDQSGNLVFSFPVQTASFRPDAPFFAVAFSPDGELLASASADETVRLRSSTNGTLLQTIELPEFISVSCVSFSPRGDRLAITGLWPSQIVVWDPITANEVHRFAAHSAWIYCVAWSADGTRIATSAADDSIKVWDTSTWDEVASRTTDQGLVLSVDWSPDGRWLVSGGDGPIKVWDVRALDQDPAVLRGHAGRIWSVRWNKETNLVASASQDGTVRVWNPDIRPEAHAIFRSTPAHWDPTGQRMVVTTDERKGLQVQDIESGKVLSALEADCALGQVKLAPHGRVLVGASFEGGLRVWDWKSGTLLRKIERKEAGPVSCLSWRPDGTQIAAGNHERTVKIWDATSWTVVDELRGHIDRLGAVEWSPDGTLLATTDFALDVKLWSRVSGRWQVVQDLHRARRPWDALREATAPYALAWSPDSRRVAAVVAYGVPVNLVVWDVASGAELLRIQGQSWNNGSVTWSPDGQRIATGSKKSVCVWDAQTGEELIRLPRRWGSDGFLAWDPSGRRLSANDGRGGLQVWDAPTFLSSH